MPLALLSHARQGALGRSLKRDTDRRRPRAGRRGHGTPLRPSSGRDTELARAAQPGWIRWWRKADWW
jgi:hypothetical protein